jgi:hypothetical protein
MAIRVYVRWNKFSETLVPATSPAGSSALPSEAPNSNIILHTSNITSARSSLNFATNAPPALFDWKGWGVEWHAQKLRERIQTEEVYNTWHALTTGIAVSWLYCAVLGKHSCVQPSRGTRQSGCMTVCILCRRTSDTVCNKTANGVLSDLAPRIYWGVLYFRNVTRFYDARANVLASTAISKIRLPSATFRETDNQELYVQISFSCLAQIRE